jgi:hypothetical protein
MILNRRPKWFLGPKCRSCRRVLGPADWVYEGTVRAPDVFGANIAWKKEIRMKLSDATPCVWEGKTREKGHEWYYNVTADSYRCRNCGMKVE